MRHGLRFAFLALLFWGLVRPSFAIMVDTISPEDQLIRACYAGYFEVLNSINEIDDNGFNAITFELACLDPIKGCSANQKISIRMANPPAFSAARIVPNLKVGEKLFGFFNCPSRLGFSQFVGLPQNSYFKESSTGLVEVPEQMQQKIERIPNGKLQLNLRSQGISAESQNSETQPMLIEVKRGNAVTVKALLEKYRSIKVKGERL